MASAMASAHNGMYKVGDNNVPEASGDVPGRRPWCGTHIKTALDWAGLSSPPRLQRLEGHVEGGEDESEFMSRCWYWRRR